MRISVYFTLEFQRMTMSQMQVIVFSYILPIHMYLALYSWPKYVLINTGQKPQLIRYANTQSHSYYLGFTLNHTSKYNCFHSDLPLTTSYKTYCIGLTADTDSATTSIFAQAHNFNSERSYWCCARRWLNFWVRDGLDPVVRQRPRQSSLPGSRTEGLDFVWITVGWMQLPFQINIRFHYLKKLCNSYRRLGGSQS